MTTTTFYDSARWGLIPAGSSACLYGDGRYKANPPAGHFARVRWITVLGSPGCGCGDYEPGNALFEIPGRLREWAEGRLKGGWRARCYTDFVNLPRAHSLVGDLPNVRWWLATLDGIQRPAAELVHEAYCNQGVKLAEDTIWAQQWKGGPWALYDESVLLGAW